MTSPSNLPRPPRPFHFDEQLVSLIAPIPRTHWGIRQRVKERARQMLRRYAETIRCQRRAPKDPPCNRCPMCSIRLELREELPQLRDGEWIAVSVRTDKRPTPPPRTGDAR